MDRLNVNMEQEVLLFLEYLTSSYLGHSKIQSHLRYSILEVFERDSDGWIIFESGKQFFEYSFTLDASGF